MDTVIRFSGDSGDGMQLAGSLFAESAAFAGLGISTFPDYPAEVRAPQGTVAGISGFQVHFGDRQMRHAGGKCDVLVAMNPAALVAHRKFAHDNATIIVDADTISNEAFEKLGVKGDAIIDELSLHDNEVHYVAITKMTLAAVEPFDLDRKAALKCRNIFTLGVVLAMFGIDTDYAQKVLKRRLATKGNGIFEANLAALEAGVNYAENSHLVGKRNISQHAPLAKGRYRSINGNTAVAWGFIAAAERSGRPLFCGSYPITPATGILEELAKHKALGVTTVQAEDEIAGICTAIGASFGGALAVTTTSGPGLALKSEALGLAVMAQIPLVVVDVQRGGPSTGLPTKSEQADLMQALYGRNGDSPIVVLSAKSPADCFEKAYMAAKIALERMMPVLLLTDGNLANGSEPWRIVDVEELPAINPPLVSRSELEQQTRWHECFNERGLFNPYTIDHQGIRPWAIPGTEGLEHRIGGLEKRIGTGEISYAPKDHSEMNALRYERVFGAQYDLPNPVAVGAKSGLLVVSWGGTYGQVAEAVEMMHNEGHDIAHLHIDLLNPLQSSLAEVIYNYDRILVCEQNGGQLSAHLNATFAECEACSFLADDAQPFSVEELKSEFAFHIAEIKQIRDNFTNITSKIYDNDELPS